ncbi:hypothetical protein [Avibacterium paragallinarum]|uniref:Uncharacterized protein n=1 Tax=Avibacterium paragallinarum TaxID=728 RepID=A0A2S5AZM3_AVIPA|nr:hypothetical protein [Avibacterium paragallinarum]AZI14494.1 hypothetical protein EIA51_07640 [Avibacterium paragallinarum]MEE3608282.1 hypothetical protein [Avibacterium paragallinarum]MEE3620795.1 hypothetical protein [Avibacterium paragallinarum]MEE3668096.1 hypothetical protein [Avibacterium paragallinarum]MEE3681368.1 hypothetical protein [Avibacterium paragallinarum]
MTKMVTPIIRYNLKERMRRFNGTVRNFNIPKLVENINSPAMQERVKLGDLHGYYGHWPRTKFGAEPKEGGVIDGKVINLEPCFRTVYLKAYEDGTIEHQAEFFDNDPGRKAYAQSQEKSGGFSSVILGRDHSFHGFDYVLFPNYSANRPYSVMLDSADENVEQVVLVLDEIETSTGIAPELQADYIDYLLDSIDQLKKDKLQLLTENKQLADTLAETLNHNDLLTDDVLFLQQKLVRQKENEKFNPIDLDDAISQANHFKTAKIETVETEEPKAITESMKRFNQVWGF